MAASLKEIEEALAKRNDDLLNKLRLYEKKHKEEEEEDEEEQEENAPQENEQPPGDEDAVRAVVYIFIYF